MQNQIDRNNNQESVMWDGFWEAQKRKTFGRFINWVRHCFVTSALVRYIMRNTQRGTLIEAGCGSGEVTLRVAKLRGDRVVLVDSSENALSLARQKSSVLDIKATFICCDVEQLSNYLDRIPDGIVFNIGVVEHFEDCTNILREMDKVSGLYSIAVIPEKSLFWSAFKLLASIFGMLPSSFYMRYYNEQDFRQVFENAGMKMLWIRHLRVLGIIPYLGVCYRSEK